MTYSLLSSDALPQESLQISDIVDYLNSEDLKQLKEAEQAEQIGGSAPSTPVDGTVSQDSTSTKPRKGDGHDDMDI